MPPVTARGERPPFSRFPDPGTGGTLNRGPGSGQGSSADVGKSERRHTAAAIRGSFAGHKLAGTLSNVRWSALQPRQERMRARRFAKEEKRRRQSKSPQVLWKQTERERGKGVIECLQRLH
jgi:hypothetical protein